MKTWFTSDYHLGHFNIIEYTKRPFKNLDEMNKTLMDNHNSRVHPNDVVIFLGDFCFKNTKGGKKGEGDLHNSEYYLSKLKGRMVFIRGNHDNNNSLNTCIENLTIKIGGYDIFCTHNPKDFMKGYKKNFLNFVGHVHEKWKFKVINGTTLINMSCDQWNFKPVCINEILKELVKWQKKK